VQPSTKQSKIKALNKFSANDKNTELRFPFLAQFKKDLVKKEVTLDIINRQRANFQSPLKNEPPNVNTSTNQLRQPLSDTRQLPAFKARQQNVWPDINSERQPSNTIPQPESIFQGFQFNTLPI
jgi:hypothetical protein